MISLRKDYTTPCYNAPMLPDLQLGDKVRLRKPHPCGSFEWEVVRLGADIGLECIQCKRRILLPRRQLSRQTKAVLHKDKNEPTTS
jgi:hypothetical protein